MQFLFMVFAVVPFIYGSLIRKKFSEAIGAVAGFVIPFLPILLFDLRHNFLNIKLAFEYLGNQANVNRVLPVWDRVVAFSLGLNPNRIIGLSFYILIAILLFVLQRKLKDAFKKKIFLGLGFVWTFSLPLYFLVAKNPSEYYFNFLLVISMVLTAFLFDILFGKKRVWALILLGTLISFFVVKSKPLLDSTHFNLIEKTRSVKFLEEVTRGKGAFNVSFNVPANEDAGFRYLLDHYNVMYSGDPKDPLIEFVIPFNKIPTPFIFKDFGVYIPQSWIKDNWIK